MRHVSRFMSAVRGAALIRLLIGMMLLVAIWASWAQAATNALITGEIERITVNNLADHWSGGTIQVGGQSVILPRNLLIDLPANRLTLKQIYNQAPAACILAGQTGLAKADVNTCNPTGTGGFATIHANRTGAGNVIAGDLFIQKGIESITGTVSYVDYTNGYFRMNGNPGDPTTGVMVRLNDPESRHTLQRGPGCVAGNTVNCSPDPRFTLDPDNYTNVFTTGYPYCIPSTVPRTPATDLLGLGTFTPAAADGSGDTLCPLTNRPANGPVPDSRRFAPIRVGDPVIVEGNFETVGGVRFLSAHSSTIQTGLVTSQAPGQPDYMFLDEVEIDMPAWQNERIRTLIIGYTTFAPADVLIWSLHYDPATNAVHEFPLASAQGCDIASGAGTCAAQGLVANGSDIFKIRHDIDFLGGAKPRLNPCAHLQADPGQRMGTGLCPNGGGTEGATPAVLADQMGILSPIPHEIQARTGRKWASLQGGTPLTTIDINGNEATNGQYLFPFGLGLGGLSTVEPVEFNLNAVSMPFYFSAMPWALDRRLSPAGCIDTTGDGLPDCEATRQPLDPFPFEASDPRTQAAVPSAAYADVNFTASALSDSRNRMFSFVDAALGKPNGDATVLPWPPVDPSLIPIAPTSPVTLICTPGVAGSTNLPPVATPDSATTSGGVSVTIAVLANDTDPDGNTLTVTSATNGANGSTSIVGGTSVSFTPNAGFSGSDSFTYTISDGNGGTSTATVSVTVTAAAPGNAPPVAVNDTATTAEDTAAAIAVLANDTDPNGDPLSVTSVTQGTNGTVSITAGSTSVRYTPRLNFNGNDSFSYTISDGRGGTATATVAVTVTPVNDAPVASNDAATTDAGVPVTVSVLANDTDLDGNLLTVTAVGPAANGTVVTNGTSVTYTPNAGFSGSNSFAYTVSDGNGGTATATLTVTVNAAVIAQITVARAEFKAAGTEWRVDGTGSVDGNTITIHLGNTLNGTVVGTANVAGGLWTFRARPGLPLPVGATTISVESSGGGSVLAFPLRIR